jgi:hypothetical protein
LGWPGNPLTEDEALQELKSQSLPCRSEHGPQEAPPVKAVPPGIGINR